MGALFGLLAAGTYGAADFVGGLVSRRTSVFGVVLFSQLIGSVPLIGLIPLFSQEPATSEALLWGGLAGIGGGTGVTFLYRGLAIGRMSVVAPITAVVAAAAPVIVGLASGERPSALALVGVAVAFVAVAMVSSAPSPIANEGDVDLAEEVDGKAGPARPGLVHALVAGASFGAFFIFLDRAGQGSGIWPLVATRAGSLSLIACVSLVARRAIKPAPGTWTAIAVAGILDVSANALYLIATRRGLLSLVAVLTSMYPASTVILARLVLGERMIPTQMAGLLCAGASIALIVLG